MKNNRMDEAIKWQNQKASSLKNGIVWTSIALALLGALLFGFWLYTNDGSAMSMLLLMAGVTLLSVAAMLYFFTPSRYLREEVSDAISVSSIVSLNRVLASLLIEPRGIYMPSAFGGALKIFIPLKDIDEKDIAQITPGSGVFNVNGPVKGITLQPPGFGLFAYAQRIGAVFTTEGLDSGIKDVLENGLELASSVSVKPGSDRFLVSMRDMTNRGLCDAIRREDPAICTRMGCPVCSCVACMIAEGTGRRVRIANVNVNGKNVDVTYELI
jgi:hypothetical protein